MIFNVKNQDETIKVGASLGSLLNAGDVVLLDGDLSAGKPTFTIVKTYSGRCNLYHMDLYRLDGLGTDFDLYEYFEGDGVCVVEWPHQVDELLPCEYILVKINRTGEN